MTLRIKTFIVMLLRFSRFHHLFIAIFGFGAVLVVMETQLLSQPPQRQQWNPDQQTPCMARIPCASILKPRLTVLGASQLGQDTEGAGLGVARPGVPVFSVLDQSLLAGVEQLTFRVQVQLPVEAGQTPEWRGSRIFISALWLTCLGAAGKDV